MIKKKKFISDIIINEEINKWTYGDNILIDAQTGKGKTYFIKEKLAKYGNILILTNRDNLKEQLTYDIGEVNNVTVKNYQEVEEFIIKDRLVLDNYDYLVCDEAHYFFTDASFNNKTDLVLNEILDNTMLIKIFMTATSWTLKTYLGDKIAYSYMIERDYSYIDKIQVFKDFETIEDILQTIPSNEKAIIFSTKLDKLYKLSEKHNGAFICSKHNTKWAKKIDNDELDSIKVNAKFNKQLLFSSTALDNGVNIKDEAVTTIILDIWDRDTFIQCLGRKRINDGEKVNLYFRDINKQHLGGSISKVNNALKVADTLIEKGQEEFIKTTFKVKYDHRIIDDIVIDNGNYKKIVNKCMYAKFKTDKLFYDTIRNGYSTFVNIILNNLNINKNVIYIEKKKEEDTLNTELCKLESTVMLTAKDREVLINTICLKDKKGRIIKNINSLNGYLQEINSKYRIKEFETSRMIDGKKKKFKHAWKLIK